jgi:hypothetical protein
LPARAGASARTIHARQRRARPWRPGKCAVPAVDQHPLIEAEARDQFLNNKPELGVFASMRAIEVRVRKLAGYGDEMIGVAMMNKAFGQNGPLTDPGHPPASRTPPVMFASAYGMLRNPTEDRQVEYDEIS